jgi:hypothetical protein
MIRVAAKVVLPGGPSFRPHLRELAGFNNGSSRRNSFSSRNRIASEQFAGGRVPCHFVRGRGPISQPSLGNRKRRRRDRPGFLFSAFSTLLPLDHDRAYRLSFGLLWDSCRPTANAIGARRLADRHRACPTVALGRPDCLGKSARFRLPRPISLTICQPRFRP